MSYCHVSAQLDAHARSLDQEHDRQALAEQIFEQHGEAIQEIADALRMHEDCVMAALVDWRLQT